MADREKVMRGLECCALGSLSDCEGCSYYTETRCSELLCGDALALLKEQEPRWIPVTERLPEKGRVVLAFGTRSCTTGQFRGTSSEPWFWWWKGNTIKRVTHWMPLPEPPKEEDDG